MKYWGFVSKRTDLFGPVSSKSVSWSGGGGGGVGDPPCIKIGYSSRLVPRAEKGPQPMY